MKKFLSLLCAIIVIASCAQKAVEVTSVTVTPSTMELTAGGTAVTITAKVLPENAVATLTWSSSDNSVATVSTNGSVTPLKEGSATITATAGGKSGSCKVTVKPQAVTSLSVNPSSITIKENESAELKAVFVPDNAKDKEVEWASDNKNVVTVDENGKITGVAAGSTKVWVRMKNNTGIKGACDVTVEQNKALLGISFSQSEITLEVGKSEEITVKFNPDYADDKALTWSSDKASIAKVENGIVTGVKEGTTNITATSHDGGHKATCKVIVKKNVPKFEIWYSHLWYIYKNGGQMPYHGSYPIYSKKYNSMYIADSNSLYKVVDDEREFVCWLKDIGTLDATTLTNEPTEKIYKIWQEKSYTIDLTETVEDKHVTLYKDDNQNRAKSCGGGLSKDGKQLAVAYTYKDAFNEARYKIQWIDTETLSVIKSVDVPTDDMYMGRYSYMDDTNDLYSVNIVGDNTRVILKNGVEYLTIENYGYHWSEDGIFIKVVGSDIYTAQINAKDSNGNRIFSITKNSSIIYNVKITTSNEFNLTGLEISKAGDVYVSTTGGIYKNDALLYNVSNPIGMIIVEN